jgi:hypothetical protein
MLGNDPESLVADGQLLRDHGMLVFTIFDLTNMDELIKEIKPDILFFDAQQPDNLITEAYNNVVTSIQYTNIPVIFTLSEDDVYLVTRKRTEVKEKRNVIADNIIDAVKIALHSSKTYNKKTQHSQDQLNGPQKVIPNVPSAQLRLPIYFQ